MKTKYEENIIQEERFRRRMREELKIQEMKLQMKSEEYEKRDNTVNGERPNAKLPKLVITKFDGTFLNWFRFWNQFESEVGKAQISPVSKFSFFRSEKELLIPKVRLLLDELPFASEGYSRAKSISLGKFGKSTEIAAAHIQCITSLPVIQNKTKKNCKGEHHSSIYDKTTTTLLTNSSCFVTYPAVLIEIEEVK